MVGEILKGAKKKYNIRSKSLTTILFPRNNLFLETIN